MKKTRRKNVLRSVKGSLNRFLSIMFIVALGSGFMAGLAAASPDMYETADAYMDDYSLYDLWVKASNGFAEGDIEVIQDIDGVDTVQPAVVIDMVLDGDDNASYTSRVYGILDENNETELNGFKLTSGRLPENETECVVQSIAKYTGKVPELGEKLTLSSDDSNYDTISGYVKSRDLTVVGFVEGPMCISIIGETTASGSGTVSLHVYVKSDFYDTDFYTDAYITVAGAKDEDTFSDEYMSLIEPVQTALDTMADSRASLRSDEIKKEAQAEIDEAESLKTTVAGLIDTEISLAKSAAYSAAVNAKLAEMMAEADPEFAGLLTRLSAETLERLENADTSDPAILSEMDRQIEEGKEAISSLSDGFWLVQNRTEAVGFDSYESNVGKVSALARIFPVFFFVVALLVALTTMTRLIAENRSEIGTLKALGFSNSQILFEYVSYSFSASVLGCIIGFAVGFRVFPYAISSAYGMMFFLPETLLPIRLNIVAWVAPVTIGSILAATFYACFDEFRSCPAELLVPKAPPAGKRILLERIRFIWKHIPFTYKVTFRNLFRYKKRFFMTIIGVAGCTALLLTGFGVKDSVNDIVDKQFGEIYKYELTIAVDDEAAVTGDETLNAFLSDETLISDYMMYSESNAKVIADGEAENSTFVIPNDPDRAADFIVLRHRKDHETVAFPGKGEVVLTEKMCEQLSVEAGDTVTIENADGKSAEFTVSDITENYITSYVYMSPESYVEAYGESPDFTIIMCALSDDADNDTITTRALESSHAVYANSSITLKETFADSIQSINGVVWVLIFAAGLLSIVVLYNLNNVNICERRKELATIKVLGFYPRETESYVFRESNILTLIGACVGLLLGIWLHSVVVKTVEVEQVMFGRNIYPLSYFYALAISFVFALLVNLIMKKNIRSIDMVEAMKAND